MVAEVSHSHIRFKGAFGDAAKTVPAIKNIMQNKICLLLTNLLFFIVNPMKFYVNF